MDENDYYGPSIPNSTEMDEDEGKFFAENSNFYNIPFSHEILLQGHKKTVCCLGLDPAGGRLLTGTILTYCKNF